MRALVREIRFFVAVFRWAYRNRRCPPMTVYWSPTSSNSTSASTNVTFTMMPRRD